MRNALFALIFLATAACGAYTFPGQGGGGTGTVSGQVIVVPCAPVEPADQPCARKAFPGLELDFTSAGTVRHATTDDNGNYSIGLTAGTWSVSAKQFMRIVSGPRTITVHAGDSIVANYVLDSGIRVPVAAG